MFGVANWRQSARGTRHSRRRSGKKCQLRTHNNPQRSKSIDPKDGGGVMLHMVCVRVNRGGLNGTKLNDIIREVDCTIERVV